jgi:site-specific recombinase XerD
MFDTYFSHFRIFVKWCAVQDQQPKLASITKEQLYSFMGHELQRDLDPETVKQRCSGIRWFYDIFDWQFPSNDKVSKFMLRMVRRERNEKHPAEDRDALSAAYCEALLKVINRKAWQE